MMRRSFPHSVPIILAILAAEQSVAQVKGPTEDSWWYYEIGGAEPVSAPANLESLEIVVGGSVELGLGYSCGKFDPVAAVSQSLDNLSQGGDDLVDAMVAAATAAIAALPAMILQRANPGLYDLFQNALLRAEERVEIATKSCEQMEAEIARGKNPYADLITLSKGNDWKVQMGIGGNDAVTAKEAVEGANGTNGVPWIGGPAGGTGQEPIRMTSDVVEAGYNVLLNRAIDSDAPAPATASSRLADLWPDPAVAANWTREVIGDNIARTCEDCGQETVSGKGLLPKLQGETEFVTSSLADLVAGRQPLTLANLDSVAAPGIAISRQVIEAIRDMPATEQGLIMDRLTAEIATARTVEKALLARRMLISGKQVPEVFAMQVASDRVDEAIDELDREIDNLLFESRVRREIVSTTVSVLLKRAAARRQASLDVPEVPVIDPNPIENGRVKPE